MKIDPRLSAFWESSYDNRRKLAFGLAILVLAVEFVFAVFFRRGDFVLHVAFGHDFIAGQPHQYPGNFYPLPRVMLDSLLTIFPDKVTRAISYLGSVLALAYCVLTWPRLAADRFALTERQVFDAAAIAVIIMSPFLMRDLDECGLQIYLLLLITLGAQAHKSERRILAGFWLAAAACYKATPLLFLPFLIWKREWKTAGSMAVWLVLLNLLPAVWLGWSGTVEANARWIEKLQIASQYPEAHPSMGIYEAPKHNNLGLRALIARYVEHYPDGHPLALDHPLFFQFGTLEGTTAKMVVWGVVLALGFAIALRFRKRWGPRANDGHMATEWAVAALFSALLSPLSWMQHLVLGFPIVLIAIQSTLAAPRLSGRRVATLIAIGFAFLVLRRHFFGQELDLVLKSYNIDTLALLAATVLAMFPPVMRPQGTDRTGFATQRPMTENGFR